MPEYEQEVTIFFLAFKNGKNSTSCILVSPLKLTENLTFIMFKCELLYLFLLGFLASWPRTAGFQITVSLSLWHYVETLNSSKYNSS